MKHAHLAPLWWPHDSLRTYWESGQHEQDGATQPWVAALLYHLIRALGTRHVVELGVWYGATSAWLALAVEHNGGGHVTLVDTRVQERARERIAALGLTRTTLHWHEQESLVFLEQVPTDVGFVFLDDDKHAIAKKVELLKQHAPAAVLAIHDAETVLDQLAPLTYVRLPVVPLIATEELALVSL